MRFRVFLHGRCFCVFGFQTKSVCEWGCFRVVLTLFSTSGGLSKQSGVGTKDRATITVYNKTKGYLCKQRESNKAGLDRGCFGSVFGLF